MSYKTGFKEGRLGIGIPSGGGDGNGDPLYPLDINGDIRLTGAIVKADGTIYSSGGGVGVKGLYSVQDSNTGKYKFGVGKSNPVYTLDVSGSLNLDGDIYVNGVSLSSGESTTNAAASQTGEAPAWSSSVTTDLTSDILSSLNEEFDTLLEIANAVQDICDNNLVINLATKANKASPTFTGTVTIPDLNIGGGKLIRVADGTDYGGIKLGYGENGKNYPVELSSGKAYVNVPWTDNNTTYSVGNGGLTEYNFTNALLTKLNGIATSANNYTYSLPSARTFTSLTNGNLTINSSSFTLSSGDAYFNQSGGGTTYIGNTNNDTIINTSKVYIKGTTGNVGIGTDDPGTPLTIVGNPDTLELQRSGKTGKVIFQTPYISNDVGLAILTGGSTPTEKFRITPAGNVGIGTTSPDTKLHLGSGAIQIDMNSTDYLTIDHNQIYRKNGDLFLNYTTQNDVIICGQGGKVGIGTTSPSQKLHVSGNFYLYGYQSIGTTSILYPLWVASRSGNPAQSGDKGAGKYFTASGGLYSLSAWGVEYSNGYPSGDISANDAGKTSIRADGIIWSDIAVAVSSDSRIKKNIVDVPDHQALEMVRNIPCRYYEYIDNTLIKREGKTIGFIAQEVKDILPMAVNQETRFIPDVMKMLSVDNENIIDWTEHVDNSNNKIFKMKYDELGNVNNIEYKFYVADVSNNSSLEKIIIGNEDNTFTFEQKWNYVFCYGRKVDDFHILDKQKLFALNFSATQELDKQQQADKAKIATLESELAAIKAHLGI